MATAFHLIEPRLDALFARLLLRSFALLWFFSLCGCAAFDDKQRQIIYRPTLSTSAEFVNPQPGDKRYFVSVPPANPADPADQRVEIWWLPHADQAAPTLLYFHGTFRHLAQNLPKINALREAGFAVLAVDYRGWGRSSPITPSEQTILQDAQMAFGELQRLEPRPGHRVLYGHSMGSGVAVDMASRLKHAQDIGGVILESAFTSFPDIAGEVGWWGRLLSKFNNERFASIDKISSVKAPLLMIHGKLDTTVPPSLGHRLFEAAQEPKQWLLIESGKHSDLHSTGAAIYQDALVAFIQRHLSGKTPVTLGTAH